MKKQIKLFSSVLALGLLIGTATPAMANVKQARDTPITQTVRDVENVEEVILNEDDVEFDSQGNISGLRSDTETAKKLLAGAALRIPDVIGETVVKGIGSNAFRIENLRNAANDNDSVLPGISKVTIEGSGKIGDQAFYENLIQEINLPEITEIGINAFSWNRISVINQENLPKVNTIENSAFSHNRISEVNLPKVTEVQFGTFYNNEIDNLHLPNVTKIGSYAFENNKLTQIDLPEVQELKSEAFKNNLLSEISLDEAISIEYRAFEDNNISKLTLPRVKNIGHTAFARNKIEKLELKNAEKLGDRAFALNSLLEIDLPKVNDIGKYVFDSQTVSKEVNANEQNEVSYDKIQPKMSIGGNSDLLKIKKLLVDNESVKADDEKDILSVEGDKTLKLGIELKFEPESVRGRYSISKYDLTVNPFVDETPGGNQGGSDTNNGNENTTPDNNTNPDNNNQNQGGGNSNTNQSTASRPHTVYAKRAMRLHKNVSLTSPVKSYKKQSRAKAQSFRVLGVSYDKKGNKRYKVNGGYITASSKYVADSHFRSSKVKQVRVIGNRVNSYKDAKLSANQKVRSYKKGTKLKVRRIVKHGRTTRFQLTNGRYITGNKQLLIMDHK